MEGYRCQKLVESVQALALNDFSTSAFSHCAGVIMVQSFPQFNDSSGFLGHNFVTKDFQEIFNWV